MNCNNNYMDYNIHDRRKVNQVNQKENEQWKNINYIKNNQINSMNKTSIDTLHENYIENNPNNNYTNMKNNPSMNLVNYNIKPANNFVQNFNSVNDNLKNNISTPSHYVSSHPILGNKRKNEVYNNFYNNINYNNEMNNEPFSYINKNNHNQVINNPNLVMDDRNLINNNIYQVNDNNLGFNKNSYNKLDGINEKYRTNIILNNELKENNLPFANNLNQKNEINTPFNCSQSFKKDDVAYNNFFNKSSDKEEHKGLMQNFFETLTNNVENKNEINNLVKQKVANMVMNEIEKKIEIKDSSFLCNKLSLLRQYFDVTHAYVINKILFIIMPYIYIRKAICESRTYYVYAHLKKKMELTQKDKNFGPEFSLNGSNNELQLKSIDKKKKKQENELNLENKNFFFNDKKMNNINITRNNSNDINYVDYSNIGLFKADLYIPLMSVITYILLHTLTVTAQKNNFIFKPDNLFNISSYVFLLIFLETIIIKFLFLLVCRDINLSFLHILSFISYKFVIMCALIITKIFFYFTYFIYISIVGVDNENTNKIEPNKTSVQNNSHNVFKNLNNNFTFNFSPYSIILFLNNSITYRFTQFYFYITVSIQMIQIFKSIHLYIHDNSNLLNNYNIKRINILILIFSFSQIFLCWILTPSFA